MLPFAKVPRGPNRQVLLLYSISQCVYFLYSVDQEIIDHQVAFSVRSFAAAVHACIFNKNQSKEPVNDRKTAKLGQ